MSASTESKVLLVQPCTLRDWLTVDHGEVLLGSGSVWWEVRMKLEGKKSSKERKLEGKKKGCTFDDYVPNGFALLPSVMP